MVKGHARILWTSNLALVSEIKGPYAVWFRKSDVPARRFQTRTIKQVDGLASRSNIPLILSRGLRSSLLFPATLFRFRPSSSRAGLAKTVTSRNRVFGRSNFRRFTWKSTGDAHAPVWHVERTGMAGLASRDQPNTLCNSIFSKDILIRYVVSIN